MYLAIVSPESRVNKNNGKHAMYALNTHEIVFGGIKRKCVKRQDSSHFKFYVFFHTPPPSPFRNPGTVLLQSHPPGTREPFYCRVTMLIFSDLPPRSTGTVLLQSHLPPVGLWLVGGGLVDNIIPENDRPTSVPKKTTSGRTICYPPLHVLCAFAYM